VISHSYLKFVTWFTIIISACQQIFNNNLIHWLYTTTIWSNSHHCIILPADIKGSSLEIKRTDRCCCCCSKTESVTAQICSCRNRTGTTQGNLRRIRPPTYTRIKSDARIWQRVPSRLPVSTPPLRIVAISTPFTCGKGANVGKLYCPGNDCSCAWITSAPATSVYSQQETTQRWR